MGQCGVDVWEDTEVCDYSVLLETGFVEFKAL